IGSVSGWAWKRTPDSGTNLYMELKWGISDREQGLMRRKCRIARIAGLFIIGLALGGGPARAGGWITGDTGGNERDAAVFDRDGGMVWFTITGPAGRFA